MNWRNRSAVGVAALLLALWHFPAQAAPVEIQFWHSMTGVNGQTLETIANNFNASQDKYKVVPSFKGAYVDSMNQAIAAYRADKQPDIIQIFEVGTQTMIYSGAIYPVADLMKDEGYNIDWSKFIQPVVGYYETADGKLMSMPFNSSTPIFYYNKDQLSKAGIATAPATWGELEADAKKLQASGQKCALTIGWQFWTQIENYAALNGIPVATEDDGYKGLNARLLMNDPRIVKHIAMLNQMLKEGSFSYDGRDQKGSLPAFTSGKCTMMFNSTGDFGNVQANAKFNWSATYMPVESLEHAANSIIGGATLWVFRGRPKEDYAGIAAYFNFIAKPDMQVLWHEKTGYLPITVAAYEQAKREGFYEKVPALEVGIKQLTRSQPTAVSRGVRLGNLNLINVVLDEELENIWAQKKTPQQGLDDAVRRGNQILSEFEQLNSK